MRIVVVGASVAGLAACEALRAAGYEQEIVLLGAETGAPYDRPPLSKEILTARLEGEDILLRQPSELGVNFRPGTCAARLESAQHRVHLGSGEVIGYDGLIVATGSRVRSLPDVPELEGVVTLRTLEDALRLREALRHARSLVVVGAGFIGLEVASSAASLGCRVTVLETAPQPLSRVLPSGVGKLLAALHRRSGVEVRCGAQLVEVITEQGRVAGVRLDDDTTVDADLVVVGVGAVPNVEWLLDSGLEIADGVVCDPTLRAAECVYACGDVARWPHPIFGSIRVEHRTTATDHGRTAAGNLAAELSGSRTTRTVADQIPYFWSDQCGIKIQLAGWVRGADHLYATADGRRFAILFGREGRLVAAMTGAWPRLLGQFRQAIASRSSVDQALAGLPTALQPPDSVISEALVLDTPHPL